MNRFAHAAKDLRPREDSGNIDEDLNINEVHYKQPEARYKHRESLRKHTSSKHDGVCYRKSVHEEIKQAQLGVPHSEI